MDYCWAYKWVFFEMFSHTARETRIRLSKGALHLKTVFVALSNMHAQVPNNDNPPPTPHKRIWKIQLCWNIWELLKRFDTQTLLFMVSSKSQRTPPKDRELFDNVYNRHPKAAEVHQMLRQDGARRSPPGRMRSGTRSGFWKLKAPKGQQRFWYTCWVLRNWTPAGAVGREALIADCQRDEKV